MEQKHWLGIFVVLAIGYFIGLKFPNLYRGQLA